MTVAEILAVIEDEFAKALNDEPAGKVDRGMRAEDVAEAIRTSGMRRAKIPPGSHERPAAIRRGPVPQVQGLMIRPKSERVPEQTIQIPATVQLWHVEIPPRALGVSPGDFRTDYARPAAESLAEQGLALGLDTFAPLEIKDRAGVGRRQRAVIVYARGWKA